MPNPFPFSVACNRLLLSRPFPAGRISLFLPYMHPTDVYRWKSALSYYSLFFCGLYSLFICPPRYKSLEHCDTVHSWIVKSLTSDLAPLRLLFSTICWGQKRGLALDIFRKKKRKKKKTHVCLNRTKKDCRLDTTTGWIVGVCLCNTMTQL